MVQYVVRGLKRLAVLLPGLIIAYFSVHDIYPFFDKRLPVELAILLTYVLGAYVLAPALVRVYRSLRPPKHLPLYCITPDGFASDPLNVGILGTRRELINTMNAIGWQVADPHTLRNVIREGLSVVYEWSYPTAPVSSLYLFGRKQDIAFQLAVEGSPQLRHHVRFWATTYDDAQSLSSRSIHWHHRQAHVQSENLLWVGAASKDVGISYIRHNFQFTHMIDPDTNQERELIVSQLKAKGLIKKLEVIRLGKPYKLINRVFRGSLHTDGQMAIAQLKASKTN